jgi:uncharacterized protein YggE
MTPCPDFAPVIGHLLPGRAPRFRKKIVMKSGFFLCLALAAAFAAPARAADPHTISMIGHGEVRAVPDLAQVTAGVTATAGTAAQALAANSTRMTGVFAAL